MALVRCRECNLEISERAKTCPSCGEPIKKSTSAVTDLFTVLLLIPVVMLIFWIFIDDPTPSTKTQNSISSIPTSTSIKPSVITAQALDQIRSYISEGRFGSAIATAEKYDFSDSPELRQLHDDATKMLAAKKQETGEKTAANRKAAATKTLQTTNKPAGALSTDARRSIWLSRGKAAAKAKLKDPSSAQFRNVYFHEGADGIPMTCGEVNSKNSFGGYGGYQRFVSAGKSELTFLEEEVADFSNVWNRLCR